VRGWSCVSCSTAASRSRRPRCWAISAVAMWRPSSASLSSRTSRSCASPGASRRRSACVRAWRRPCVRPLRRRRGGDRAGEDVRLARLAGGRLGWASAFPLRPPERVRQPLLLLRSRPRVGAGVRQDLRLRAVSALALPERARVGEAAGGEGRALLRAARQRLPLGRGRRGARGDLRALVGASCLGVLPPLRAAASEPVRPGRPRARLPLPARAAPARAVRHARLRPPRGGPCLVRAGDPTSSHSVVPTRWRSSSTGG